MAHSTRNKKTFEDQKVSVKLKSQQIILEKITAVLLENMDNNIFLRNHLKLFIAEIRKESNSKRGKCRNEMLEIYNSLKSLKGKSFVIDLDEKLMEDFLFDLADKITSLKETHSKFMETLVEQEHIYRADLEALDKRMVELMEVNQTSKSTDRLKLKITAERTSALFPAKQHEEVEQFDKFLLRTGGHSGGWTNEDHLLFLRHQAKYKGQALADSLHGILPDVPFEVIQAHEVWFTEYNRLKRKQNERIKAWREARKKIPAVTVKENKEPQKPHSLVVKSQLAHKKKQQVQEWKIRKLEHEIMKEQNEQEAKKKATEANRRRVKKEQELQRHSVLQYKKLKREEEERRVMTRESNRRDPAADSKLILMFQERDREYIRRCEEEFRAKSARALIRRRPKVTAERDPERLMRPTAVWRNRVEKREESEARESTELIHLQNLPRLKVPTWRQLIT